ncbi:MAG TPA: ABC transporter permease [Solirubrobacteraceae bacterium]|jgi:osmoprotectant transport system permease protein|nr:ABC transporter permease [Solirubrobacteraceae bacterium]
MITLVAGPNIPNFGGAPSSFACERANRLFCTHWFTQNWGSVLWPALRQHVVLTLIAIAFGFAISTALALLAYRKRWLERPVVIVTSILYTIPSLALFEILEPVPGLGLSATTAEVALVSYTLLILFRNTLTGLREVPDEVRDAARGMGMSPTESLLRVELPLAVPAIIAGLRIATVTVISLATVASLIDNEGLGVPILNAISNDVFKTELISAGALAVLLALIADGLLVGLQRLLTPWARA